MNIDEVKAAAERVRRIANGEASSSEVYNVRHPWCAKLFSNDERMLRNFALLLLSDALVTAEWLREEWGFEGTPTGMKLRVTHDWERDHHVYVGYDFRMGMWYGREGSQQRLPWDVPTQGQFTMLALGLGLQPKTAAAPPEGR